MRHILHPQARSPRQVQGVVNGRRARGVLAAEMENRHARLRTTGLREYGNGVGAGRSIELHPRCRYIRADPASAPPADRERATRKAEQRRCLFGQLRVATKMLHN